METTVGVIGKKLRGLEGGRVAFICPGCGEMHQVTVNNEMNRQDPRWSYNGNPDAPTFIPSVLVRGTRFDLSDEEVDALWDRMTGDREKMLADASTNFRCHSFVRDGRIQFLNDCTHALAGQMVDLPDVE